MCMEYKEVKQLVDDALEPTNETLSEIKLTISVLPGLVERLSSYKDMEKKVEKHDYILCGINGKPGLVDDTKNLKEKDKKNLTLFFKIIALMGAILGILATGKTFFF